MTISRCAWRIAAAPGCSATTAGGVAIGGATGAGATAGPGSSGIGAPGIDTIGGAARGDPLTGGPTAVCGAVVSGRAEAMAVGTARSAGRVLGEMSTTVECVAGTEAAGWPTLGFSSDTRSDGSVPGQIPPA